MAAEVASSTRFLALFSARQRSLAASCSQAKSSAAQSTLGFRNVTPRRRGEVFSALCPDKPGVKRTAPASSRLSPVVVRGCQGERTDAQGAAAPLFRSRVSSSSLHTAAAVQRRVCQQEAGLWRRPCSGRVIVAESATDPDKMSTRSASARDPSKPFSVLFVCLGNICRSPSAEAVFRTLVEKKGLDSQFFIDSAGTIDFHEGNPADARMRSAAKRRGIDITSISRGIKPSDFQQFDLILAMDRQNHEDLLRAYHTWSRDKNLPANGKDKVKLMCSYCREHTGVQEVPDPYYGGREGFERVLDLLQDACTGLLDEISSTALPRQ
ncbi:hypothetical protein CBR_g29713 [Chara braunii]|uniref:acid phosphatase n=1 Tax=Chara braunii TaxID=69332 RepID=A0A388LB99_CHABU|nr:hypothetical protein CBR_g29713 [Chara braunii]|eukprot:GBG79566.1 hypothetical protein CBR_g29713 [Chara braunii]